MQPIHISTAYTNPDVVDAELGKEITAGWIINDHINIMKAKIDLKAAFHLIPVRAVDGVHLGMDRTCLPFGLRSALSLINNYANWIMARNYGAQLLHYTCQEAMYRVGPSGLWEAEGTHHNLTFLGIVINMSAQQLRLPPWQAGTADRANQVLVGYPSTRPPRGNCSRSLVSSPLPRWHQQWGSSSATWLTCPPLSGSSTTTSVLMLWHKLTSCGGTVFFIWGMVLPFL